jgi:chromosome segregation ATPase
MKNMHVVGIVVGLAAIVLGIAALVSAGNSAASLKVKTGAIETQLTDISTRLAALETARGKSGGEKQLDDLSARMTTLATEQTRTKNNLEDLATKVQEISDRLKKVDEQLAQLGKGQAPAAAVAAMDDEKIRGIVRQEMQAQNGRGRGQGQGRQREDTRTTLKTRIGLDDDKTEKVAQVVDKLGEDIRNVWQTNRNGDRDQNVARMQELQKTADEQVAGMLTPDELEKYKQWQGEQRNRGGQGRRGQDNAGQNPPADTPAPPEQF